MSSLKQARRRSVVAGLAIAGVTAAMLAIPAVVSSATSPVKPAASAADAKVLAGATHGMLAAPRTVDLASLQGKSSTATSVSPRPELRPAARRAPLTTPRQEPKILLARTLTTATPPTVSKAPNSAVATGAYVAPLVRFSAMSVNAQYAAFGTDQDVQPPDTQVALGPTSYLEAVNRSLSVWSRTGQRLMLVDLNRFFAAPAGSATWSPRVSYDSTSGHFFMSGLVYTQYGATTEYVAVSQTTNPMGQWRIYKIRVSNTIFGDSPKLGFSNKVVVVSWADFDTNNTFLGQETWVLDKAQLIAGTTVAHTTVGPDVTRFAIVPAVSVTATDTQYLTYNNSCGDVSNSYSSCTAAGPSLGLISITGSPAEAGGITWHEDNPTVTPTREPPNADQYIFPAHNKVVTGDDRFLSTTFAYGEVLTTGGDSCLNDTLACARVVRASVTGATPVITLDTTVGFASQHVYFPAVASDPNGNIFIAANLSSLGTQPEVAVLTLQAGTNDVFAAAMTSANGSWRAATGDRWGHYSSAAVDPINPYDIAVAGEFPGVAETAAWATEIALTTMAAPTVTGVSPAGGPLLPGTVVTITGRDFTPGAPIGGAATVSFGGVSATSIKVTSNTSITAVAPGHVIGTVDVRVGTGDGLSPATPADAYTYRHSVDVLTRDAKGALSLYPGNGIGGFATARQVGSGWSTYTSVIGPGDFNGDGHPDLMGRTATGALQLFPGNGTGGFLASRIIGAGWGSLTAIVGPGDFDGDGHSDLIARSSTGALLLYPGNGTGGFLASRTIGAGWGSLTAIVGPGDFDGDGHSDLIARSSTGALLLYPGNGIGGFLASRTIGAGWSSFNAIVAVGDFNGDTHPDLMARTAAGALWLYPGTGSGGFLAGRVVGAGWSSFTAIVGVGDLSL